MKIRTGFVSNSSSSSFVVAFPHKPESIKDVQIIMFGKQKWHYTDIYGPEKVTDIKTNRIAETIFEDIKKRATREEIFQSIRNGWFDSYIDPRILPGFYDASKATIKLNYKDNREEIEKIWEEAEKINDKRAWAITEAFISGNKNKFIVVLEYCDENGDYESILEHTDIFKRLPHIRTSYH